MEYLKILQAGGNRRDRSLIVRNSFYFGKNSLLPNKRIGKIWKDSMLRLKLKLLTQGCWDDFIKMDMAVVTMCLINAFFAVF